MEQKFNPTEKREIFQPSTIAVREAGEQREKQTIEGDAIMCGVPTILYEDEDFREIEIIEASCIDPAFIASQNMFINAQHKREKTFGRQGANLEVECKPDRLSCRCTGTSGIFQETRDLINDGVYVGMSFEFWPNEYTVEKRTAEDGKTEYIYRHKSFRAIGALTVAMQPAYPQTSVGLRELYREINHITDEGDPDAEAAKREAEEQAAKEEAERKAAEEAAQREAEEKAKREKFTRERTLRECQASIDTALL